MAFEVGAIVSKLELKKDQWNQSIKKVKEDQKSLSGLVLRNSKSFGKMGRAMTVAGGIIVGGIGLMVKAYAGFDQAMTESLAIMGDVSDETKKKMSEVAKTISEETVYSAKELAEAYFFLASAGMDTSQSMTVLGDVARFAQAGTFDLAIATDLLTDAQTAMGLSSKDSVQNQKEMIRVSDVLVGANTLANASVLQFSEALTTKAAAALVNVNKELEEGVAVLAAFADKGIKGRLAGTQLGMMLNALDLAAMRNKDAWEAHGLTLWTATGEMKSMGDIIADLEGLLGDMTPEMRSATLAQLGFTVKTKASVLTLMGSSEKIKKWTEDLKKMGGKTKEVSDKQLKTFNAQLKLLRNTVTNAAISIGESLAPMIEGLIIKIKKVAKSVSDWIKEHPKLTTIIAKAALGIGALMTVLGPLMMMLPGIVTALPAIAIGIKALLGPIGLVAAAALAAYNITKKLIKAKEYAIDADFRLSQLEDKLGKKLREVADAAGYSRTEFIELTRKYKDNTRALTLAIKRGDEGVELQKALQKIGGKRWKQQEGLNEETDAGSEALKIYNKMMGSLKEKTVEVTKTTETLLDHLQALGIKTIPEMSNRVAILKGHLEKLHQLYKDGDIDIGSYKKAVEETETEIAELSATIITQAIPAARQWPGVVSGAVGKMKGHLYGLKEATGEVVEEINIQFRSMSERFIDIAMGMGDAFGNFSMSLMTKGSDLGDALSGLWSDIGSTFKKFVSDYIADEAKKLFLGIVSKSKDMATSVTSGLSGVGKAVGAIGKGLASLITTLASAIAKAASTLAAAAPSLLIVLGIALAAYAAFKLVGALFKKKPKTGTMEAILKDISYIQLAAMLDKMDTSNFFASEMFPKIDYTNSILAKSENILRGIRGYAKGVLSALTKKGTIYVDVFRSAIIEKMNTGIKESLKETDKAEAIKEKIAILDVNLKSAMKELQERLETAEGEERKELEEAIVRIGLKAQAQRKDFLKQLEAIEKGEKDSITKTGGLFASLGEKIIGGLGKFVSNIPEGEGKFPSAQVGAVLTQPGLIETHGTPSEPEYIIPSGGIEKFVPEKISTTKIVEVKMDLQQTFYFNNQVDPNFTKKYVLNEVIPIMYEGLETGARKTRLKEILGVP